MGLGFEVFGLGLEVFGLGRGFEAKEWVSGLGFEVLRLGSEVFGLGFEVLVPKSHEAASTLRSLVLEVRSLVPEPRSPIRCGTVPGGRDGWASTKRPQNYGA